MKQKIQLMGLYAVVMMCVSVQVVFGAAAMADHNKFLTDYVRVMQESMNRWRVDVGGIVPPEMFVAIKGDVVDAIEGLQNNLAIAQYEQKTNKNMSDEKKYGIWAARIKEYGFLSKNSGNYTYVKSYDTTRDGTPLAAKIYMGGQIGKIPMEATYNLKDISEEGKNIRARQYKIHLMPTDDMIDKIFEYLCELVIHNEQLRSVIAYFKVYNQYGSTGMEFENSKNQSKGNAGVLPRIVIYIADDKKNTQEALNILYKAFKGVEGMKIDNKNVAPRFNTEVTSLIYVTQGSGDSKKNDSEEWYDSPYKVYYNPAVIPPEDGKTHHLIHPKTGEELVPKPEMFAE